MPANTDFQYEPLTTNRRHDLLMDFLRVTARLVQAGVITREISNQLARQVNQGGRKLEDRRCAFSGFADAMTTSLRDGILVEGRHVRVSNTTLALHIESTAEALRSSGRRSETPAQLRVLLDRAREVFPDLVLSKSERVCFNGAEDRRRAYVLSLPALEEFVGRKISVPVS